MPCPEYQRYKNLLKSLLNLGFLDVWKTGLSGGLGLVGFLCSYDSCILLYHWYPALNAIQHNFVRYKVDSFVDLLCQKVLLNIDEDPQNLYRSRSGSKSHLGKLLDPDPVFTKGLDSDPAWGNDMDPDSSFKTFISGQN